MHKITSKDLDSIEKAEPRGFLAQAIPYVEDKPEVYSIFDALVPFHDFKKPVSFEIWSFRKQKSFYFHAPKEQMLEMIRSSFNAVWPNAIFKKPKDLFIPLQSGHYISAATMQLEYHYCPMRALDSFADDPLRYLIEAMKTDAVLQVMFKPEKISDRLLAKLQQQLRSQAYDNIRDEVLEKLSAPCFRALIRAITVSEKASEARQAIEIVTNAFSVFSGTHARLKAKIVSFPIRNSFGAFKKTIGRSFPRFFSRKSFILSIPELAALVHMPIGRIPGVRYSYGAQLPMPA